ncbi:hypothetical protein YYC_04419 [Plasmodium yoelii 17X]|uniref:Uncharacterized protein n=4 Tax=Plasmodium yoelii TaxID=5861 RepID=A0AAE9WV97_PLAYO|nr:conserved Plasmodium protein, unknown function [Plasmodium yoelii]EAA16984.1 hypothetical protein [Plasmodium yoelii yoelii]ETB57552.1 hypothetical protein YYC_04419 [Plasmodium yoelii 17X]WBY57214.1 hypothetical protein Py17XNL_000900146 [Plasmodium yoelii yoelii]CDU17897.1 conserved Plasmodium protein, unknown function [Plasmodium yoelii]VTZ78314.1 conserved Plasmodium protein, unknown function [Plasmodium yoelii]|eukprot:XP_725419.1 conserved Plasmodium protein, unknown function [Plasmodium yoelii]
MLIENEETICNVIYECNNKIKLYIKINDIANHIGIDKIKKEMKPCCNQNGENDFTNIKEIKYFKYDYDSEIKFVSDTINGILHDHKEGTNGCVISFFNVNEQIKNTCKNNINNDNNNVNQNLRTNDINYLIDNFFNKISNISFEKNKKQQTKFSIRYGILNCNNLYDLLENYCDNKEYYQKIKSCALKWDETTEPILNIHKTDAIQSDGLKMFNKKTKEIKFFDSEKLKEILNFAEKEKIALENKLDINDSFYCSLINISIGKDTENDIFTSNLLGNINNGNNDYKSGMSNFFFINVYYAGSHTNVEEEKNKENEVKNIFCEFSNIIRNNSFEKNIKLDNSNIRIISKLFSEIFTCSAFVHFKIILNISENYGIEKNNECILNFLYSIDLKIKDFLRLFTKNMNKSGNNNKNLNLSNNERYKKIENILFKNVDLDEKDKYNIIKEAINFPEEHVDKLLLLNKTFEENYLFYKEKENEFHDSIKNIVEKQNQIIKKYEEEEKRKNNDINNVLTEIFCIDEQNLEIKNEIEKYKNLNLNYLHTEKNIHEEDKKKIQNSNKIIDKEYENFLKFRNESKIDNQLIEKRENEHQIQVTKNSIMSNDTENDNIRDICKIQEEEYLKNLNDAIYYAKNVFQETHNLKKHYDDIIKKKMELLTILKNTTSKFNEKANSLMNNYKSAKELRFIYTIVDTGINIDGKYDQKNLIANNELSEYKRVVDELEKCEFNDIQLNWINKMNSLSRNF